MNVTEDPWGAKRGHQFRADDRVLLLSIPTRDDLAALSRILMHGVLVAIGTREDVDRMRPLMADFDNIMFIEAEAHQVPWREHFFNKIVVPPHLEGQIMRLSDELARLLTPDGQLIRVSIDV